MKGYKTEQKQVLLVFLQQNAAQPLTIEEIIAGLTGEHAPGKSTVYRLVNQLVEEGTVRRFVRGNNRHFLYQLMQDRCHSHLHCRCVTCGQLFHLDDATSTHMGQMLQETGFVLDPGKTTLLGTCRGCGGQ